MQASQKRAARMTRKESRISLGGFQDCSFTIVGHLTKDPILSFQSCIIQDMQKSPRIREGTSCRKTIVITVVKSEPVHGGAIVAL